VVVAGVIGGLLCGVASNVVIAVAGDALNQGKCFGFRAFIYVPQPTMHPVIVPCYA